MVVVCRRTPCDSGMSVEIGPTGLCHTWEEVVCRKTVFVGEVGDISAVSIKGCEMSRL